MEKLGYGVMVLLVAAAVLTAPFFYARAMSRLGRRRKPQEKDRAAPSDGKNGGV